MIEVKNLTKRYGQNLALDRVSFKIEEGTIVGFLGPNGAGKSTAMNIITGYLSATSGEVTVSGKNTLEEPGEVKKMHWLPAGAAAPVHGYDGKGIPVFYVRAEKGQAPPGAAYRRRICRLVKIENVYNRLIRQPVQGLQASAWALPRP